MLKQLQKIIKQKGLATVTSELGYRSQGTVLSWIRKKKIPMTAEAKVHKYINQ